MNEFDKMLHEDEVSPFTDVGNVYAKYRVEVHLKQWQYLKSDIEKDCNKILRKFNYDKFVVKLVRVAYQQLRTESQEVDIYD